MANNDDNDTSSGEPRVGDIQELVDDKCRLIKDGEGMVIVKGEDNTRMENPSKEPEGDSSSSNVWDDEGFLSFLFRRSTMRRSRTKPNTDRRRTPPSGDQIGDEDAGGDGRDAGRSSENRFNLATELRRSFRRLFRRSDSFSRAQQENDVNPQLEAPPDAAEIDEERIGSASDETPESRVSSDELEIEESPPTISEINRSRRGSMRFTFNHVEIPIILTPPTPSSSTPPVIGTMNSNNRALNIHNLLFPQGNGNSNDSTIGVEVATQPPTPPAEPTRSNRDNESRESPVRETDEERDKRVGFWPHTPCSMLAVLACTLGIGNICRFSFLSFQYGGGFVLQFVMLSVILGFPMLTFFMTLGQYVGSGIMDMWKISPVFQGVGVASLVATTLIGVYTIVPVSWLFFYFRDSFITNSIVFKWGECMSLFKSVHTALDCRGRNSTSESLRRTVPEYFHGRVLQRSNIHPAIASFGELKIENVFNLAVVWMLIFVCLSKGLKSYGKVVFVFAFFPLIGILLVSVELLRQAENGTEYIMNANTYILDTFASGSSWVAAAREVFFTWGIHGAVIMQITSHNRFRHNIKRDSTVVILATLSTLLVVAFLSCACFAIIFKSERGSIKFLASSFETERNLIFLAPNPDPNIPLRFHWSNNLLLGEEMINSHMDVTQQSNYQVFRLITELFPAAVANLGANKISPFWAVLLYLTLIAFGLAQQLAIWRCAIEGIVAIKPQVLRSWETTITFIMCVMGFILGLPITTELGIFVLYFLDFCIGSAWWIMIIYLVLVLAVFIVRGRPFSADDLVSLIASDKFTKKWLSNLISFSWSVIIPTGLLVLTIVSFRNGNYNRIFGWFDDRGYRYWPSWVRQLGTFIQLIPLLAIPVVGLFQTCRYLGRGSPNDLFDRLQMLYRPSMRTPPDGQQEINQSTRMESGVENPAFADDPPPKYTPPPSYNTATGLKLLKRLNSLRRSLRYQLQTRAVQAALAAAADDSTMTSPGDVEMSDTYNGTDLPRGQTPSVFFLNHDIDAPSTSHSRVIHLT